VFRIVPKARHAENSSLIVLAVLQTLSPAIASLLSINRQFDGFLAIVRLKPEAATLDDSG